MVEKHLELVRPPAGPKTKTERFPNSDKRKRNKRHLLREAKHLFNAQLMRDNVFEGLLLHESGWDILLALYIADADGRRLDMATIGQLGHISSTMLIRWITVLADKNMLTRVREHDDPRRVWLSLTSFGREKTEACLEACVHPQLPALQH